MDLDARIIERWRSNEDRPEILVEVLEWIPAGAAEPFQLDLARYFAAVFGESGG